MKKSMILAASLMMLAGAGFAAPYSDVPADHWACKAVDEMAQKGVIQGFPNGTFKGNDNISRYQLAMITSRLLAGVEQNGTGSVSKNDLQTLEKLTVEFADELALLGVKVTSLEEDLAAVKEDVASLKSDVSSIKENIQNGGLEKVRLSGDMMASHYYYKVKNANSTVREKTVLRLVIDSDISEKVSPKEWHELYVEDRGEMPEVAVSKVPETDQKRPNFFQQIAIFLRRNIRAKISDLQYVLVTLIEAPVLAIICGLLTRFVPESGIYTVMDNKNLPSYLFMAIIVSIFLGMSGSAEEIIKDRALLKREKFLNLSYKGYIWSKMIYMAAVCAVQTFLFIVAGNAIIGIHGMFWTWWLILFVSAFLSALIGLLLSQCLSSVVSIYITIPVLLIPQILLCGLVVHFDDLNSKSKTGNVPVIGEVIPSRWAYEALAVATFSMNDYENMAFEKECEKFSCQYYEHRYIYELQSRLETIQDAARNGETPDPIHMQVLRKGMETLSRMTGIEPYDGNWSYLSLDSYLDKAAGTLSKRGNKLSLEIDNIYTQYSRDHGKEALVNLKHNNYNLQLENLVVNRTATAFYTVIDDTIVPKVGQIYLKPVSCNGRAPFYSGYKYLGDRKIPTFNYNLGVLLLMCIILSICLLYNVPGQFVRKEKI